MEFDKSEYSVFILAFQYKLNAAVALAELSCTISVINGQWLEVVYTVVTCYRFSDILEEDLETLLNNLIPENFNKNGHSPSR